MSNYSYHVLLLGSALSESRTNVVSGVVAHYSAFTVQIKVVHQSSRQNKSSRYLKFKRLNIPTAHWNIGETVYDAIAVSVYASLICRPTL